MAYMQSLYPEAEIIKDIGSGINFKRKGLQTLLDRLMRGDKLTLVVACRDRLCRFGFELPRSIWSNKTVDKSWFSKTLYTVPNQNLPRIFSPSSTSSLVECTDSGNTVKKSRKIRIFLKATQKQIIKQWFGVSRFVYNTTVKLLQDSTIKANWKAVKTDILNGLPDFCKSVPYQIKSIAIKDACKAVSNA
ncbi:helix-turn-helix domain-containing protein, partial [Fischerella thermalis]|uniref:helix-turn-helix domain-containing protein n=1 Tax=Fischerella thermalis TaxID=372787 RepID=UPI0030770246